MRLVLLRCTPLATEYKNRNIKTILTFIVPSLIGLLLFMTPISYNDAITIPIAIISKALQSVLSDVLTLIVTVIVVAMALASLLTKLLKPKFVLNNHFLNGLLNISPLWLATRVVGAVFILLDRKSVV